MKRKSSMSFGLHSREEPEINLIPFIDVLLVVLIFLMLSTTYSKFTEMQLRLPTADTDAQRNYPKELIVTVSSDGRYAVNKTALPDHGVDALADALTAASEGNKEAVVIISADAIATHQSVISVMEAARRAGLMHITFAAQSPAHAGH